MEDSKEEAVPFLIYDQNTKSNSKLIYINLISIYSDRARRGSD